MSENLSEHFMTAIEHHVNYDDEETHSVEEQEGESKSTFVFLDYIFTKILVNYLQLNRQQIYKMIC